MEDPINTPKSLNCAHRRMYGLYIICYWQSTINSYWVNQECCWGTPSRTVIGVKCSVLCSYLTILTQNPSVCRRTGGSRGVRVDGIVVSGNKMTQKHTFSVFVVLTSPSANESGPQCSRIKDQTVIQESGSVSRYSWVESTSSEPRVGKEWGRCEGWWDCDFRPQDKHYTETEISPPRTPRPVTECVEAVCRGDRVGLVRQPNGDPRWESTYSLSGHHESLKSRKSKTKTKVLNVILVYHVFHFHSKKKVWSARVKEYKILYLRDVYTYVYIKGRLKQ